MFITITIENKYTKNYFTVKCLPSVTTFLKKVNDSRLVENIKINNKKLLIHYCNDIINQYNDNIQYYLRCYLYNELILKGCSMYIAGATLFKYKTGEDVITKDISRNTIKYHIAK